MAIVTISHEMGAGGPEIGQQLAERLDYRYIDHELISDAAQRYGLLEDKLAHLDETKPSFSSASTRSSSSHLKAILSA
jgi:hypothetical protein